MTPQVREKWRKVRRQNLERQDAELRQWVAEKHGEEYAALPAHQHDGLALSQTGRWPGCRRCRWLYSQPPTPAHGPKET